MLSYKFDQLLVQYTLFNTLNSAVHTATVWYMHAMTNFSTNYVCYNINACTVELNYFNAVWKLEGGTEYQDKTSVQTSKQ